MVAVGLLIAVARWAAGAGGVAALAALLTGRGRPAGVVPGPASATGSAPGRPQDRLPARLLAAALAVAVTAMLAAPAIWSASALDVKYAGTLADASAGPRRGTSAEASAGWWRTAQRTQTYLLTSLT